MSFTLSISGNTSVLSSNFSPPLQLESDYECALLYLSTFNSIPNIDGTNNKFYYGSNEIIEIPEGTYELQDIADYLKSTIQNASIRLNSNNNTLKTSLFCTKEINFQKSGTLGNLLGFREERLKAHKLHESAHPINILSTTVVRIECDIISGSYINGKSSHIIHEFAPNIPPGYRIIEIPKNVIYFPINQKNISSINIRLLDNNNKLINFRGEDIQIYLHIKQK